MSVQLTPAEQKIKNELPHLFGMPHYPWSLKFFNSTNRFNFLVSANQVGKSTVQIRKAIDWATNKKKWPSLWKTTPTQFWYFYPNKATATSEFEEKWVPELLPRGDMKKDKSFGWEVERRGKDIYAIHFNSGVSIYMKTYAQDVQDLQTSTVYAIFCDEELPYNLFQELRSRLNATYGYFHMVFTATLGQDEWRRTIEPSNESEELFRSALKIQVSMYDCLKYTDGTDSPWTLQRIKEVEDECATESEIQRRVHGRFIVSSGLKYVSLDRTRNIIPFQVVSKDWHIYSAVDLGSGGESNHPSAIVFIAVKPDFKNGIVFRGWRGDGVITTSMDVLEKHQELCEYEDRTIYPVIKSYDWASKDFFNISTRTGAGFTPADKRRDRGENLLNTLFKSGMLKIMDGDPELSKLIVELSSLMGSTAKGRAKDDFCDALRYCAVSIPWDFDGADFSTGFTAKEEIEDDRTPAMKHWEERRAGPMPTHAIDNMDEIFDEWDGLING